MLLREERYRWATTGVSADGIRERILLLTSERCLIRAITMSTDMVSMLLRANRG